MHSKLPHINLYAHCQFITFRTKESVDGYVTKLQNSSVSTKQKQYEIDKYLDHSVNGAYFYGERIEMMRDVILKKNGLLYELEVCSIMPNHVHLLLKQQADLAKIMKCIKGESAAVLNKSLLRTGTFWLRGYYDVAIRDQKHFDRAFEYIVNNPKKANLQDERVFSKYEL